MGADLRQSNLLKYYVHVSINGRQMVFSFKYSNATKRCTGIAM